MLRKFTSSLAILGLLAVTSPSLAAKANFTPEIPEVSGLYEVPGHPGLKVRVFVHEPAKPQSNPSKPGPTSSLVCGLTDPAGTAEVAGAGWVIPSGTWEYRVNTSVPSTISSYLSTIVANSFGAWESISALNSIDLVRGPNTSVSRYAYDGQNIIAWGRTSGSALGVTYIWYQNGEATEIDTIMNNKFSWNWGGGGTTCAWTNVYDAQNILTHELGHWFGLDDHYTSDYVNHTMYGYGSKWEVKKNTPTAGDVAGIEALY